MEAAKATITSLEDMMPKATTATKETGTQWKIPPDRIASDDCAVHVGRVIEDGEIKESGIAYHVHKGEWVDMLPCRSLTEIITLTDISTAVQEGGESLRILCQELAQRIISWNWTGMDGVALPQPYNAPAVLERLTDDEVAWLLAAAKGAETSDGRKNA
tara:strand:+ start:141 stop:617 length:477 start_codon:yes stop_codon:yes gene_type:complete